MSTATIELTTAEKLRLYLAAHHGMRDISYEVCAPGKCWRHSQTGKFTIKSRLRFTKEDGLVYTKGFGVADPVVDKDKALTEEQALKGCFFGFLKAKKVHLCDRCGGQGGWSGWPGYTCYDCGGNGIDPNFDWEDALTRALDGEDFEGDYIRKTQERKEREKAEAERAAEAQRQQRQAWLDREFKLVQECVADLAPRAFKARTFYRGDSQELAYLIQLERLASITRDSYHGEYNTTWIKDFALPAILKAEDAAKAADADPSQYLGTPDEPITVEATIVFQKDFPSDYGTKTLNVLRDDKGNRITYWNNFTVVDPIQAEAFGTDGKRFASKGDKIKFTATVKKHEIYKGVRGTVVSRARKAVLIKAAPEETK